MSLSKTANVETTLDIKSFLEDTVKNGLTVFSLAVLKFEKTF